MLIQATVASVDAATGAASSAVGTAGSVVSASLGLATIPIREGAKVLSGEVSVATLTRHTWHGDGRMWIEVRGLDETGGEARGRAVVDALRGRPGVTAVRLNRPLARVVVEINDAQTTLHDLCQVVDDVERRHAPSTGAVTPHPSARRLPGDGLLLVSRGVMIGMNAAGLAITVAGRLLRIPGAPVAVDAAAALLTYQPKVRQVLEDRFGTAATDTVMLLVSIGARIAVLSPVTLSVDLALQGIKATESRAAAHAWGRYEPLLARHAEQDAVHRSVRPAPVAVSKAERHGKRMAMVQLIGTGLVGVITRNVTMASQTAVAAAPKALRTTTESFAATLGHGLAEHHGVLPLRPGSLRRLDTIDTVLIDPRVLVGNPLASAIIAEARTADVQIAAVDTGDLGELRPAFDHLSPVGSDGVDAALAAAVLDLQTADRTVAVLSSAAFQALAAADVALGVMPGDDIAPPWESDLLLEDLVGAWQVLHALPAARDAAQRGITISTGASTLAGLLIVPGVRGGRRANPVDLGAAAGLLSGYLSARRIVRAAAPKPAVVQDWHALSVDDVRAALPVPDVTARTVAVAPPENMVWQFAKAVRAELSDPLMPVLALCSAATAMLGSPVDAMMVSTVLIGNCMLAAGQQLQAENRLNRLLAAQTPPARLVDTVADDTAGYREIVADQLLPGDLIEIRSNEVVPADARIIEATDLEVDESSLTGESLSVDKQTAPVLPGAELAERYCMLYAGTTVVAGTAVAVVTAVGADTQVRRAAELAAGTPPVVGLQHQLSTLMSQAFPASAIGGGMVGLLGMLRGGGLKMALGNAIAVAVAAVPEGMPLMATLAQHASSQRLTKTGALVRVPRSVEALGRLEVVCFDKTGTLSENRLRVTRIQPMPGQSDDDVLRCAAHAAPAPEGAAHAHATDQAILEAAGQAGVAHPASVPDAHLPFRSGRAFSASVSGTRLTIKGAPEVVLAACAGADPALADTVADLAADGLRVIAVAHRDLNAKQAKAIRDDADAIGGLCADGLSLVGFLGISDTPRPEAPQLLADLAERGIGIRLITGDHPVTATAIAAELGMPVAAEQVITGSQWNALSRTDQEAAVHERVIFARMAPENKVQIVQTLERTGTVCAMVGDGANDAAAIRAASVGLGVVARGSDSAHATADIVLTDGRIGALTDAVDEGRRLWRGVQLAVEGLLGGNLGEVMFGVIGTAIAGTSPLNNRQLLLLNMLTDALPATSVAVSTPAGAVQRVGRGLDRAKLMRAVAVRGVITGTAATAAWTLASMTGTPQRAATVALISLVSTELGQSLIDSHAPLVVLTSVGSFVAFAAMVGLPGISQLLGCTPVGPIGWGIGVGSAAAAVAAVAVAPRLLPAGWQQPETAPVAVTPVVEPRAAVSAGAVA
ncbi:HAD-IC family P-type ATPase [Mycobacterium sp. M1]|uniref:HAD-IC family P-type ATPase n=1 Tax=Mycolicibacter acidiphilus TaxID=2835306 RepID=A0ABS5RJX5_9MYCO|nr:HAD-IC family P-type ATPase [Mycolicibacter acidiphilus]